MADFSIIGHGSTATEGFGADLTLSKGTIVAPNATIHTKGSFVELIASTGIDYNELILWVRPDDADKNNMFDIAIGAAASEQVIIENVNITGYDGTTAPGVETYAFPIHIPAGTRISCRTQAGVSSGLGILVNGMGIASGLGGSSPLNFVTTEGADTATTAGVIIDPGASSNTKGAYSEITASATRDYAGFILSTDQNNNTAVTTASWLADVAIGGAGSEEVLVHNQLRGTLGFSMYGGQTSPFFPIAIPKGSRIAVRAQCTTTNLTDRKFTATIIGVS